jgi:hypothetical protein
MEPALPLKMDLDRPILPRFQRPTGPIPSLMLDLEVYTGAIDDFDFEDYLNDPRESKMLKPVDFHHHVMEVGPNAGEMILAAPSSSSGTKTLVESFNNKSGD